MGKGKVRIRGSQGSKNRWKKGQSGASNPELKKHRDAAKGKFKDHLTQVYSGGYEVYLCNGVSRRRV